MRRLPLVLAIVSFVLAFIVIAFSGGDRSVYSGLFFILLGVVLLVNARQRDEKSPSSAAATYGARVR